MRMCIYQIPNIIDISLCENFSLVYEHNFIRHSFYFRQIMRSDNNSFSFMTVFFNNLHYPEPPQRINSTKRLIQNKKFWFIYNRNSNFKPLLHAKTITADNLIFLFKQPYFSQSSFRFLYSFFLAAPLQFCKKKNLL